MEFRILGPLEVEDEGRVLKLGGAKQRGLLTLLLLRANQAASQSCQEGHSCQHAKTSPVAHVSPEGYHFAQMNTTNNLLPLNFWKTRMTIGPPNASTVIGTF